jgi:acyl carrier protein
MPSTETVITADQVPAVVREVTRLVAPQAPAQVVDGDQLIGDLGFHSLAQAELAFTLEDLFDLDAVTPERAMTLQTVGDIVALITEALDEGNVRLPRTQEVDDFYARYRAG